MDKAKEIFGKIRPYQFWILLGVSLVLPLWGWWTTTDQLAAQTKARIASINGSISSLPKQGEQNANDYWIQGVRESNDVQGAQLKNTWSKLYLDQQKLLQWPQGIGFGNEPDKATDPDLQRYNLRYPSLVEETRRIVNTVDNQFLNPGPVVFPDAAMPRASWAGGAFLPTILQMKNAQEDLWLLSSLLHSIRRTNGSAKVPLKAVVRTIRSIRLRGGSLSAATGAGPAPEGGARREREEGGGGPPRPVAASVATGPVDARFDPSEEMGPDPELAAAGGGRRPEGDSDERGSRMGGAGAAPAQDPAAAAQSKRYLEELPQAKKRGFYLEVVIEQKNLPDLLVQLSKSEWPVRILHVNLAELQPDPMTPPADEGLTAAERLRGIREAEAAAAAANPTGFGNPAVRPLPPAVVPGAPLAMSDDAAMADPSLVVAAISGYIVIYNPPPAAAPSSDPAAPPGQPAPGQPSAAQNAPPGAQLPAEASAVPNNPAAPIPTTPNTTAPDGTTKSVPATTTATPTVSPVPEAGKTPAATTAPPSDPKGTPSPPVPSKTKEPTVATPPTTSAKAGETKPATTTTNPLPPKK